MNATGCTRHRQQLTDAIKVMADGSARRELQTTVRSGIYGDLFVMPSRTVARVGDGPSSIVFDPDRAAQNPALAAIGRKAGTLVSWKREVASLIGYSSIGITIVGAALAPSLIDPAGLSEAFLVNLVGRSSSGKTVITLAAMSVQGEARRDCMVPPNLAPRALEEVGVACNQLLLPIDDLSKIGNTTGIRLAARSLTYHFVDGGGRLVSHQAMGAGLPFDHFSTIGLISYERGSAGIAELAREDRQRGEQARMLDLPVHPEYGVFDRVPKSERRPLHQLASVLETAASAHYGTLLPRFLKLAAKRSEADLSELLKELIDHFIGKAAPGADPVQLRAAKKFGLIYAALVIARRGKLVPWSRKDIYRAVVTSYRGAMRDQEHARSGEELILQLRALLAQPGRTITSTPEGRVNEGLDGPWLAVTGLSHKGVPAIYLRDAALKACCPNGVELQRLLDELESCAILGTGRGRGAKQVRLHQDELKKRPRVLRCSMRLIR